MIIFLLLAVWLLFSLTTKIPRGTLNCGLFGYSGTDPVDIMRLKFLAVENQTRGDHSTGVYGNYLYKKAQSAKDFVLRGDFTDAVKGAYNIIGHTRHATMGLKTDANAHPFEIFKNDRTNDAEVVGTHNGMLFDHSFKSLCEKYNITKPDVDSKLIYDLLSHHDFDYDKTFSEIEGAMALAFIRPNHPDYLFLYHRLSRPLHIGYVNNNLYYSSEVLPLELIECDTVQALETDMLYTFKKGSLVEVSDIKKSSITSIKQDQTLTNWQYQTATHNEKVAIGLYGAGVNTEKRSAHHTQNTLPFEADNGCEYQGCGVPNLISKTNSPIGNSLQLLPEYDDLIYKFETLQDVDKGRFYISGSTEGCYLLFQLLEATVVDLPLPAWMVRVKGHAHLTAMTTHNGLGIINIPSRLCGTPLKLEIVNPLRVEVIYEVTVNRPVAGRVLEVALDIPFRSEEEKDKTGEDLATSISTDTITDQYGSRKVATFNKFSDWLAFTKSLPEDLQTIRNKLPRLPGTLASRLDGLLLPERVGNDDTSKGTGPLHISHNGFQSKRWEGWRGDGPTDDDELTNTTTEDEDILNMNSYTLYTTLDEVEAHQRKIKTALSSIDDAPAKIQDALLDIEPFLEFLRIYLKDKTENIKNDS